MLGKLYNFRTHHTASCTTDLEILEKSHLFYKAVPEFYTSLLVLRKVKINMRQAYSNSVICGVEQTVPPP